MTYGIACVLGGPVVTYQHEIIREIADRFSGTSLLKPTIPSHFSLKYEFETEDVAPVESLIERFCKTHRATLVEVGGFGEFPPDVVYINVCLSPEAQLVFREFLRELRQIPWMTWSQYDGEEMTFHATLADRCGPQLREVREFLHGKEQTFLCSFSNITLGVQTRAMGGITREAFHRRFALE
jgi:2'-5' RNA ligase